MTEKPRETQAESHVVEFTEKVNNSSLMKHPIHGLDIVFRHARLSPSFTDKLNIQARRR